MSAEYTEKDMNISTGNCRSALAASSIRKRISGYHCRFTTGTGLRLHIEQWGGNHGFGHYLSDRKANWRIGEIVSDTPATKTLLLQHICQSLNLPSIRVLPPPATGESQLLGMARIINAKTMLQLYATAHPELELSIHLTDEQVSANNGYYYLNNGNV